MKRAVPASRVAEILAKGGSARVDVHVAARFQPGDRVRARNLHPRGHTRLPRYARGREGVVQADHGVFVFPDARAAGKGDQPQHLYSVRFSARELWGPDAPAHDGMYLDLWDAHLDPA